MPNNGVMKWLVLHLLLAIVTCSPDKSILSTDVETGTAIARLEDAHRWVCLPCSHCVFFFFSFFLLITCLFHALNVCGAVLQSTD